MSMRQRRADGTLDIDFKIWWKRGLIVSGVLVAVSLVSLFTRGLNMGFDFEGGVSWEVSAPGVSVGEVRDSLAELGLGQAKIQIVGSDTVRVQGPADSVEKQAEVRQKLADLAHSETSEVNVSTVGPSWGGEITKSAIRALIIFLIVILLYLTIRLEWQMAVGAIVALLHDIIVSVGFYSLLQIEVAPATVIAFLTILGYSIYDTVVVFDKAQENAARPGFVGRVTYTEMMSVSMNQVLVRSMNTTVTSLIPVISLLVVGAFIMGAVTIEEFATALTVGLFVGAYSSIFIAPPTVIAFKEREPRHKAIRERLAREPERRDGRSETDAMRLERDDRDGQTGEDSTSRRGDGAARTVSSGTQTRIAPSSAIPPRPRKKGRKR